MKFSSYIIFGLLLVLVCKILLNLNLYVLVGGVVFAILILAFIYLFGSKKELIKVQKSKPSSFDTWDESPVKSIFFVEIIEFELISDLSVDNESNCFNLDCELKKEAEYEKQLAEYFTLHI